MIYLVFINILIKNLNNNILNLINYINNNNLLQGNIIQKIYYDNDLEIKEYKINHMYVFILMTYINNNDKILSDIFRYKY